MKGYVVFWVVGEDSFTHKVFLDETKAREYVDQMNKTTELGWFQEEVEVVE